MNRRVFFLIPLALFLVLAGYFAVGLTKDPKRMPNMLAGKSVPDFDLKPIKGRDTQGFSNTDLKGSVALVNIFGSWCVACQIEHPFLMDLKESEEVTIHGINWREEAPDAGPAWLTKHGDPYALVGDDPKSRAAIAFGVTGAPETFLVDARGVIRHKIVGPLDKELWENTLKPMIEKLRKGGAS
ncbi:MAG: DsbE family thiol:disulfide interchange protein [Rhodospirillales bacterium]|nr:DsbE family thiol:disulfide interchange protein [Rhodospirillales bacterium]